MDIVADGFQVTGAATVYNQALVTAAEQMPKEFVTPVKARRVNPQKPLHSCDQIGPRRFDHQMKMVGHQIIRMHLPSRFEARFAERVEEALAIGLVLEDRFPAVTSIQHVI